MDVLPSFRGLPLNASTFVMVSSAVISFFPALHASPAYFPSVQ